MVVTKKEARSKMATKKENKSSSNEELIQVSESELEKIIQKRIEEMIPDIKSKIMKDLSSKINKSSKKEEEPEEDSSPEEKFSGKKIILSKDPSRMTLKEMKEIVEKYDITMGKGSGNKGVFLRKDYIEAIKKAISSEEKEKSEEEEPSEKEPPKKRENSGKKEPPKKKVVLESVWDEEKQLYMDESGHVYERDTGTIFGVFNDKDESKPVRPLRINESVSLSKKSFPLWHIKVKGRPVNKPTNPREISEILRNQKPPSTKSTKVSDEEAEEILEKDEGIESGDEIIDEENKEEFENLEDNEESSDEEKEVSIDEGSDEGEDDGGEISIEGSDDEDDLAEETEESIEDTFEKEVTEDQFRKYVEVKVAGKIPLEDTPRFSKESGLDRDTIDTIIMNYGSLSAKYPHVRSKLESSDAKKTGGFNGKKRLLKPKGKK